MCTDRLRHKGHPSGRMPLSHALPTCFPDRCTPAVHRQCFENSCTHRLLYPSLPTASLLCSSARARRYLRLFSYATVIKERSVSLARCARTIFNIHLVWALETSLGGKSLVSLFKTTHLILSSRLASMMMISLCPKRADLRAAHQLWGSQGTLYDHDTSFGDSPGTRPIAPPRDAQRGS